MEKEGLVYATQGEIYLHYNKKEILLAKREAPVGALAVHNGELYDGGSKGIFNTLMGKNGAITQHYKHYVFDLCSHKGNLYGCTHGDWWGQIFNALTGEVLVSRSGVEPGNHLSRSGCKINGKEVEDKCFGGTKSLCSYDGKLLEVNEFGNVVDPFANKLLKEGYERGKIHLHNNTLYATRRLTDIEEVFSGKKVASRKYLVSSLCTHNGELLDTGIYSQIVKTLTGEVLLEKDHAITALCSINPELTERILKNRA